MPTPFAAFVPHAEAFCAFIEDASGMSPDDYTAGVQLRLAQLYAAGLTLPWRSTSRKDENGGPDGYVALAETNPTPSDLDRLSHEEWKRVYEGIGSRLAGPDMYVEMFDPLAGMRSQSSEAWLMTWPTFIRKFALVSCNGVGARKKAPRGRGDSDLKRTGRSMRPAPCVPCKPSCSATSSLRHLPLPRGLTSAELVKRSGDGAGLRPALLLDSLAS